MRQDELIQWLLDNGGPVIRYRTRYDLLGDPAVSNDEMSLQAVLRTEKTRWLLEQMDHFGQITNVDIRVLNALHGMKPTCLENIIPRLLERGLRAGVTIFDEKMDRFRQYVDNPLVQRALDHPESPTVEGGRAIFIATVMASYFIRGGYNYEEIGRFVRHRIDSLSQLAGKKDYTIHLNESELAGLPKQWKGKPILRPEMVPMEGTMPLPLIHDLYACAYLHLDRLPDQIRIQIDDIVNYVIDERYQAFPPGYGYIWPTTHRQTCYACGWNLDLPNLESPDSNQQCKVIQRLELLAHFQAARKSAWFQKGLQLLETFRTEQGSYCFPSKYLLERKAGYYVGGEYMGLEDDRRNAKVLELESTFRMLLLKRMSD